MERGDSRHDSWCCATLMLYTTPQTPVDDRLVEVGVPSASGSRLAKLVGLLTTLWLSH